MLVWYDPAVGPGVHSLACPPHRGLAECVIPTVDFLQASVPIAGLGIAFTTPTHVQGEPAFLLFTVPGRAIINSRAFAMFKKKPSVREPYGCVAFTR